MPFPERVKGDAEDGEEELSHDGVERHRVERVERAKNGSERRDVHVRVPLFPGSQRSEWRGTPIHDATVNTPRSPTSRDVIRLIATKFVLHK